MYIHTTSTLAVADIVPNEGEVFNAVHVNLSSSTLEAAYESGLSQNVLGHTLHEEQLYPVHVLLVQGLQPGDSNLPLLFCDGFYTKLQMNLIVDLRSTTHKEWSKQSPQPT